MDAPDPRELIIEAKTGRVRQAGAVQSDGHWVVDFRRQCEHSLYLFTKSILKRDYLTPTLHKPVCAWLQRRPPFRKLLLLPRNHAKTSIVAHGLPLHILIQPKDGNLYLPGRDGRDTRVLLACEKAGLAEERLRVCMTAFESNTLLQALWPQCCWRNPRRESKKWNEKEIIIPRPTPFGDPSIRTIGVDGALTGSRVDAAINDDLISVEAANSETVMLKSIEWHGLERALYDSDDTPEFTVGTRWGVKDLYERIQQEDPSVEVLVRAIVEHGAPIYPEKFSLQREAGKIAISDLQKEFGVMFHLLYMNSVADPDLTDFNLDNLRTYRIEAGELVFDEDHRDAILQERETAPMSATTQLRGVALTPEIREQVFGRDQYLRLKYS